MALYVISDLHLSTDKSVDNPMDVFGFRWKNYHEKIEKNWRAVITEEDTVVIPGDISWGMKLDQAKSDFAFLNSLPGKKIIGKGNHDLWWQSMKKMEEFCSANNFHSLSFLFNNCYETSHYFLCGSRGWWADEHADAAPDDVDFEKVILRECGRLRASLNAAVAKQNPAYPKEILLFLHFPVRFAGKECPLFMDILREYGIKRCYFGHIHGVYDTPAVTVEEGIEFHIVSADYLNFMPKLIAKEV